MRFQTIGYGTSLETADFIKRIHRFSDLVYDIHMNNPGRNEMVHVRQLGSVAVSLIIAIAAFFGGFKTNANDDVGSLI